VYVLAIFPNSSGPGQGAVKEVEVRAGAGPRQLAERLSEAGVISSPTLFALWLRAIGGLARVRAGTFRLVDSATPLEVLSALSGRGIEKGVKVTIPEGFTLAQIGFALQNAGLKKKGEFITRAVDSGFLGELGIPGPSSEGYLFPDTYFFSSSDSAGDIIRAMWANFNKRLASIGASIDAPKSDTLKKVVTLASIVQAEAKAQEEMPVIAGVYQNRLDGKIFSTRLLQADPSVSYGCEPYVKPRAASCIGFNGVLTRRQLEDRKNPYNTYVHQGLPPGPICAPGLAAIRAAIRPAEVPYFYFVVDSNGRHAFSTTFEEHQKAVSRYRRGG
jgi:UPF0755 protein